MANIIHHRGDLKKATTHHNQEIERKEQIFVLEWGTFVKCAPYDNHFVYESKIPFESSFMCTCGSPAVLHGLDPRKGMLVCMTHASSGVHQTGENTWQ